MCQAVRYGSDNPGTLTNLARLLNHGKLAGTGKLVILPVDQGFEHGPARSFAANPPAYDPRYHFELAILQGRGYANEAGCNAYAAPLGFLEAGAREFAGEIPLILKVNDHDALLDEADPTQALTSSVEDALRLGCVGIGFTIYPGSAKRFEMYEQIRAYAAEAKRCGLVVVIWSYARGSGVSTAGETSILYERLRQRCHHLCRPNCRPIRGTYYQSQIANRSHRTAGGKGGLPKNADFVGVASLSRESRLLQSESVMSSNVPSMVAES